MDNFPSNSAQPPRSPTPETKHVERVVQGPVKRQKMPLGRRISHNLLGGDVRSVWSYVMGDIVAPAARDLVADTVSGGVERMLFGESSGRRRSRSSSSSSNTPYNRYSQPNRKADSGREMSRQGRSMHDFDEIIIDTRAEAMEVLERLHDMIERYDGVSVGDLYEMLGISGNYMDAKWGWTDLRDASVSRVRNGYLLNLPKPQTLK